MATSVLQEARQSQALSRPWKTVSVRIFTCFENFRIILQSLERERTVDVVNAIAAALIVLIVKNQSNRKGVELNKWCLTPMSAPRSVSDLYW